MEVFFAFAAYAALSAGAGLIAGARWWRRAASLALALSVCVVPLILSADAAFLRALLGLGATLTVLRAIDLAREHDPSPLHLRVALMFAVFDVRQAVRTERMFDARGFALGLGGVGAAVLAFRYALDVDALWLRWVVGAAGAYLGVDGVTRLQESGGRLVGYRIPVQHRAPILSRSLGEFWSRRWNLNIRDWLYRHCHRPLAAAGHPVLGVVAGFAASAVLHFWFVAVSVGYAWALVMSSFFVVQGVLMLLEWRLRLRSRALTLATVALASPLFVEPLLQILEGGGWPPTWL